MRRNFRKVASVLIRDMSSTYKVILVMTEQEVRTSVLDPDYSNMDVLEVLDNMGIDGNSHVIATDTPIDGIACVTMTEAERKEANSACDWETQLISGSSSSFSV